MNPVNVTVHSVDESELNPRKTFEAQALSELAESIRALGILQPLTLRPKDDRFEVVIGARRLRAAKLLSLDTIPAIVRELTDEEVLEIMLVENDQRADVTPLEEAEAIQQFAQNFGRNAAYIAERIGRSPDFTRRRLKLASLHLDLKELLKTERIGIGSADLLAALPEELQTAAAEKMPLDATTWRGDELACWSTNQVRDVISAISRRLDRALWKLDEEFTDLTPCQTCPLRSSAQPSLLSQFAENDDRCLNATCWDAKVDAWTQARRDEGVEIWTDDVDKLYRASKTYTRANTSYSCSRGFMQLHAIIPEIQPFIAIGPHVTRWFRVKDVLPHFGTPAKMSLQTPFRARLRSATTRRAEKPHSKRPQHVAMRWPRFSKTHLPGRRSPSV